MSLTNYLNLISQQRENNLAYAKDYRFEPLTSKLNLSFEALNTFLKFPNTILCKIIDRKFSLYSDVEDLYYYEFVDVGSSLTASFVDWKYFYIPLSYSDVLISNNKLPYYYYYDLEKEIVEKEYFTKQNLLNLNITNSTYYITSNTNNLHPYLNNFVFTGNFIIKKDGTAIYEYKDYNMFSDDISISYYSELAPKNFYITTNVIGDFNLIYDINLQEYLNHSPYYLNIYDNEVPILEFTGRITLDSFSKIRWFEYNLESETLGLEKIILPYYPSKKSNEIADVVINNKSKSLFIPTFYNQQYLTIQQVSSNKIVYI